MTGSDTANEKSRAADAYTFSTIDASGSSLTTACAIDMLGRAVGYCEDEGGTHGF